jgi:hypothetical protein
MSDKPNDLGASVGRDVPSWGEMRASTDHADKAYEYLNSAPFSGDPQVVKAMIEAATVHATLALHDKVEELTQTLKVVVNAQTETNAELSQTVKKATNVIVVELRKATVGGA